MKKLFAVCLLVGALFACGMTAEAQTKKKSTRTSQSSSLSFTFKSFMKDSGMNGYELKSLKQIKTLLTSNGYKFVGGEYTQVSELDADCYIYRDSKGNLAMVTAITDSNVGVTDDVTEITFNFINSTERDKFIKGKTNDIYGAGDQVQVLVEGNNVTLIDDCYYC